MFQCCKLYILRCRKRSRRNRRRRQSHQRLLDWIRVVFNASFASKCSQDWAQQDSITTRPTPSQQKCSAANTVPSLSGRLFYKPLHEVTAAIFHCVCNCSLGADLQSFQRYLLARRMSHRLIYSYFHSYSYFSF